MLMILEDIFLLSKSHWKKIIHRGDGEMMMKEGEMDLGHGILPEKAALRVSNILDRLCGWSG